jgi:hypothetical protein
MHCSYQTVLFKETMTPLRSHNFIRFDCAVTSSDNLLVNSWKSDTMESRVRSSSFPREPRGNGP